MKTPFLCPVLKQETQLLVCQPPMKLVHISTRTLPRRNVATRRATSQWQIVGRRKSRLPPPLLLLRRPLRHTQGVQTLMLLLPPWSPTA